jgi:hypothetical protein
VFVLGLACLCSGTVFGTAAPQDRAFTEYEVKAAFLYRFLAFVEWPAEVRVEDGEALIVGVYGSDPFGDALDPEHHESALRGRRIEVRRLEDADEFAECHVVFFGVRDPVETGKLLSRYRSAPILTVGESELFLKQGGIIRFFEVDKRVRFEIEDKAARRAGLTISSKLLRLGVRSN